MNLAILAEEAAARFGERRTLIFEGEPVTNLQILERSRHLQLAFAELGLGKGKNAALCMINSPIVYSVFGGIFRTGATAVPVMFQLTAAELRYIIADTEAHCVITDASLVGKVREAVAGLDHVQWLAVSGGENRPEANPPEYALEELLTCDEQTELPQIDEEDVAVMLYTSGTTGRPKGVMLTHGIFLASSATVVEAHELHLRQPPIIGVSALPLAHIYGIGMLIAGFRYPMEFADSFSVVFRWFDPERFLQGIQEYRCTDMSVVPTMLAYLLNHPKFDDYDLSSLVVANVGASPLAEELAKRFMDKTGARIRQLYGMTENAGIGTCARLSKPYHPQSAGLPYAAVELKIVDEQDNFLPPNVAGEIVTRGRTTMKGYFKQPEATVEALRNGWLHTGDIGYLDKEGWLYVVDRKKDMIIRGGENIYPAEIEQILYQHEAVAEAAVVGIPDSMFGESVVAFVVKKAGIEIQEEELQIFLRQQITTFKCPQKIYFVEALPKSGVGKILRRELREQAKREVATNDTNLANGHESV